MRPRSARANRLATTPADDRPSACAIGPGEIKSWPSRSRTSCCAPVSGSSAAVRIVARRVMPAARSAAASSSRYPAGRRCRGGCCDGGESHPGGFSWLPVWIGGDQEPTSAGRMRLSRHRPQSSRGRSSHSGRLTASGETRLMRSTLTFRKTPPHASPLAALRSSASRASRAATSCESTRPQVARDQAFGDRGRDQPCVGSLRP